MTDFSGTNWKGKLDGGGNTWTRIQVEFPYYAWENTALHPIPCMAGYMWAENKGTSPVYHSQSQTWGCAHSWGWMADFSRIYGHTYF